MNLDFSTLVLIDTFLNNVSLALESFAFLRLRYTEPSTHRPFKVPGGNIGAWCVTMPKMAVIIFAMSTAGWVSIAVVAGFNVVFAAAYFAHEWWKTRAKVAEEQRVADAVREARSEFTARKSAEGSCAEEGDDVELLAAAARHGAGVTWSDLQPACEGATSISPVSTTPCASADDVVLDALPTAPSRGSSRRRRGSTLGSHTEGFCGDDDEPEVSELALHATAVMTGRGAAAGMAMGHLLEASGGGGVEEEEEEGGTGAHSPTGFEPAHGEDGAHRSVQRVDSGGIELADCV
jgi:hypothetical protein